MTSMPAYGVEEDISFPNLLAVASEAHSPLQALL
jgi:hypothetical protein